MAAPVRFSHRSSRPRPGLAATLRLALLGATMLVCLGKPGTSLAEEPTRDDKGTEKTEKLLDRYEESVEDSEDLLPAPGVSEVNLDLNWRHWRQSMSDGEPKANLQARLHTDTRTFGFYNAAAYAAATTYVLRRREVAKSMSANTAGEQFRAAQRLAPDLPYPALEQAGHFARHHPTDLANIFGPYVEGLRRAVDWPNTRVLMISYGIIGLLLALTAGLAVAVVGQVIRQLGIAAHDVARLLPDAVTKGQVLGALAIGTAAAIVALESWLVGFLIIVAFASLPQRWSERAVTMAAAGLIASLPYVGTRLAHYADYPGSEAQQLLEAQHIRCGDDCIDELESRLEAEDDELLRYTVALAKMRRGTPASVENALELLENASFTSDELAGYVENLQATALIAQNRTDKAIELLEAATDVLPEATAPWYNLMRAYRMAGEDEAASNASKQASRRDVEAVQRKSDTDRRDPPSFLMLAPVPPQVFWNRHLSNLPTGRAPVLQDIWRFVAGPRIPIGNALHLGIGLLVFIALAGLLPTLGWTSTPCPNCGLAREPDDPDQTGGHAHCLPCYRTFVGGAELGYRARVHYETLLGRRATAQMILRRALSILLPGAGHAVAGRAFAGFALGLTIAAGAFLIAAPEWLWQPPRSIAGVDWLGAGIAGWILVSLGGVIALWTAYTDIEPVEMTETEAAASRGEDQ